MRFVQRGGSIPPPKQHVEVIFGPNPIARATRLNEMIGKFAVKIISISTCGDALTVVFEKDPC
jgi:hypothetical protein